MMLQDAKNCARKQLTVNGLIGFLQNFAISSQQKAKKPAGNQEGFLGQDFV